MLQHTTTLSGLILSATLASAPAPILVADTQADTQVETIRLQHLADVADRESVWSRLFSEGPTLSSSLIYFDVVLDDANPWSHTLAIVDSQSGVEMAQGGFMALRETLPMSFVLAPADNETPSINAAGFASLVRGELFGSDGSKHTVVGARIVVQIDDLALIVPVQVEAFVPLSFDLSESSAEALFDRADLLIALAELDDDSDPDDGPGKSGGAPTPIRRQAVIQQCLFDAWNTFAADLSASWSASGIAAGSCLADCMFSSDAEPGTFGVSECLPGCGLGALASGEGMVTWAWSAHTVASQACEPATVASSGERPSK